MFKLCSWPGQIALLGLRISRVVFCPQEERCGTVQQEIWKFPKPANGPARLDGLGIAVFLLALHIPLYFMAKDMAGGLE